MPGQSSQSSSQRLGRGSAVRFWLDWLDVEVKGLTSEGVHTYEANHLDAIT
jgi:hypothetical protein